MGIYPEMKHPTFFNNLDIVKQADTTFPDIVLDVLNKYNYTGEPLAVNQCLHCTLQLSEPWLNACLPCAVGPYNSDAWRAQPIFLQSFEQEDLIYVSKKSCIPLVQLLDSPG